jgi:hypothetical protein
LAWLGVVYWSILIILTLTTSTSITSKVVGAACDNREQLRRTEGSPEFVFYDGPPFATGLPHYGHLLAGSIKASALMDCDITFCHMIAQ